MSRLYAITNQKGGVGKSTTCACLGAALTELGKRVLMVDLDPQAGLTTSLGHDPGAFEKTIYNALKHLVSLERYESVRSDIEALAKESDELLQEAKGSVIVIAHGAYTYLCHEYGIEQLSLEYGEKEPTLATLQELLTKAKEHNVTTVFSLKTGSKRGINRVAQLLNASIVELDPLSSDYIENMRATVHTFHKATA